MAAFREMSGVRDRGDRLRTIAQQQAYLKMMITLDHLEMDIRDARVREALIPCGTGASVAGDIGDPRAACGGKA